MKDYANFVLTNRIPRRLATRLAGWISRIEQRWLVRVSLVVWQWFGGSLHLDEAETTQFESLHDCFVRRLKPNARQLDDRPDVFISPCDGVLVAAGPIDGTTLVQAKGFTYTLEELLVDSELAGRHRNGVYAAIRLKSTMYHRFHAPADCRIDGATRVNGDTWNVNPPALDRIDRLYCRNERVIVRIDGSESADRLTLVAVGAILVGSVHLNVPDEPDLGSANASFRKGDELGYFHLGSTIIVLTTPGLELCERVQAGAAVRMGQPLLRRASAARSNPNRAA